ncbi:MAG: phosphoadenylyl-sulfate reductase [Streptosporangiales bacterium]|nr:phosphoadenylyl-sulfate reductase [Streptosporangiales bacterium]
MSTPLLERIPEHTTDTAWLRYLAHRAAAELADKPATEIVRWAAAAFGDRLAATSSMADAVVIDLVAKIAPGTDVLFLDTGYHFVETIATKDAIDASYPVRVRSLHPEQSVEEQDATYGRGLFARDPDRCCALRKVAPLDQALHDYSAWVTGLRRADSPNRADTPVVEFDERRGRVKVNPIAAWSDEQVQEYVDEHQVLVNPLLADGYCSVGCGPCTRKLQPGEDARAGRWAGMVKTECGIHR